MATGLPVAKTLIEYNCNDLEESEEKEKEPIDIDFTEQKAGPENTTDFRLSGVQEGDEEDIALTNFIENYKSKLMRNFFYKETG